jgi:hypothetical protein
VPELLGMDEIEGILNDEEAEVTQGDPIALIE